MNANNKQADHLLIHSVRQCSCPKCHGKDLVLTELWKNHSIQFDYNEGKIISKGYLETGNPYKVEAFCNNCMHEWRLRGVIQISDVSPNIA